MSNYPRLYIPNFISPEKVDSLYTYFVQKLERKQYDIIMFGKKVLQPRLVCFYADVGLQYTYSKTTLSGF